MPVHKSSPLSRRRFLRSSASGIILLAAARFIPGARASAEPSGEIPGPLRYFSANEYRVLQAVSRRLIGPVPPEFPQGSGVDVPLRADTFLSEEDPEIQDQYHLLLTLFSSALFAFLFDFRLRRFLDMSADDQDSYLMDWMKSGLEVRRKGFSALKKLCLSMYYTDERSWPEIGYDGMFLPEERP
jgi:Gluconate 2-dehydrogenase subunit 3